MFNKNMSYFIYGHLKLLTLSHNLLNLLNIKEAESQSL